MYLWPTYRYNLSKHFEYIPKLGSLSIFYRIHVGTRFTNFFVFPTIYVIVIYSCWLLLKVFYWKDTHHLCLGNDAIILYRFMYCLITIKIIFVFYLRLWDKNVYPKNRMLRTKHGDFLYSF